MPQHLHRQGSWSKWPSAHGHAVWWMLLPQHSSAQHQGLCPACVKCCLFNAGCDAFGGLSLWPIHNNIPVSEGKEAAALICLVLVCLCCFLLIPAHCRTEKYIERSLKHFRTETFTLKWEEKKKKNSGESQWAGRNFALWYSFHTKSIHILCFLLKQLPLANFHLVWLIHRVLQVLQLCLIPRQEEQGVGERFATRDGQVRLDGKSFFSSLSIFPERLSQSSVI